jgi:Asp-tRNA(Asn)/Glu-tRNA(Gln) amidotransferase A subunit family amidase
MTKLNELSATGARKLLAAGETNSEALTKACLERILARNDDVGAFAHIDPEFSILEAQKADRESPKSPLHGIPFAVKDVIDTQDFPTERGTPIHRGRRPSADAKCVSLMREAGAVLLGKLVTTEYAMFTPNETRHPHNLEHTAGGSSSGTGAAVADNMVPIAFGNQTAGSLIRPAAFCGVYGLKPTHGTTDGAGILPLQLYFDTLGYMARDVEDIQHFYGIVSGESKLENWPDGVRPKIGVCETYQWEFAEPESRQALYDTAEQFAILGADVEHFTLPKAYADLVAVHRCVLYRGIGLSLADDYANAKSLMSEGLANVIEEGMAHSAEEYASAFSIAEQCRASVNDSFNDFDVIVCPSTPGEAPRGRETGSPIFQVSWTLLGVPCLNLPIGTGPHGLPLGVQLIGRRYDDAKLLAIGKYLMANFDPLEISRPL